MVKTELCKYKLFVLGVLLNCNGHSVSLIIN